MKKSAKAKNIVRVDPYLEGMMAKLVDHLINLEKKIDTLIAQATRKPSGSGGPSKPFQNPPAQQSPPRHDRVMYEAICADCNKVCEVPFKPSEDRPVYCKECFAKRKSGGSGRPSIVLTPVALAPKPVSKLGAATIPIPPVKEKPKKAKKNPLSKKAKKKK
jgi:CxxC-x17-CxxC domain-containing protein